ncbi:unnamed protein product [Lactuca saligna]|uniref:Uncharacterized protein n=1 Tax=Lactuca saligna TaxID=75948 RepID=A0AA36E144_LACSI|nr:unnamed protein product [Lactuca saligna]
MEKVKVEIGNDSEETDDYTVGSFGILPTKVITVKSILEQTNNHGITANVSNAQANIDSREQIIKSLPKQTTVIPPKVTYSKSNIKGDETSNINVNLFDKHTNVTMGDEGSKTAMYTSTGLPPAPTSPPQISTILPTTTATVSPTFEKVMQVPITTLFSSQSIDTDKIIHEEEANDDDLMVSFADLEFNPNEDDVPNEAIMFGK